MGVEMQEFIAVAKVVFWAILLSRLSMAITTDLELRKKAEINRKSDLGVQQILREKAGLNGL